MIFASFLKFTWVNMIFDFSMDPPRIERGTPRCKRGVLPLDYGPLSWALKTAVVVSNPWWVFVLVVFNVFVLRSSAKCLRYARCLEYSKWLSNTKILGGDPSAGSPTDTLWRLNLPCLTKVRPWRASSMQNSVGLTGISFFALSSYLVPHSTDGFPVYCEPKIKKLLWLVPFIFQILF